MHSHLQCCGFDLASVEDLLNLLDAKVGQPDSSRETSLLQLLHCAPRFHEADVTSAGVKHLRVALKQTASLFNVFRCDDVTSRHSR